MQTLSPLSTEYLRVPVHSYGYTLTQIKACTVDMAVIPHGYEPSSGDWNDAAWADGSVAYAILLVGPGANINLASKTSFDVWVRITTPAPIDPETTPVSYTAVIKAGTIRTSGSATSAALPPILFDQRAKVVNIGVTLGDDLVFSFAVQENGAPYQWAGAVVDGDIRATEDSLDVIDSFTFNTTTPGLLVATLTDAQVVSLGVSSNYYSIRVTKNAITRTWVKGQIIIEAAA